MEKQKLIDFNNRTEQEQRQHDLINGALRNIISKYKDKMNDDSWNNRFIFVVPDQEGWSDVLWSKVFEDLFDCGMYRVSMITMPNSLEDAKELAYQKNVVRHEYLHLLGFPDMYRYINDDVDPVGKWSLMGSTKGIPTIYEKMKYGQWISDDGNAIKEIKEDGDYELSPCTADAKSNTVAYKIPVPESYDEYFIVEYRKYNSDDGLLVYRVNKTITHGGGNAAGPPDELYVLRGDNLNEALIDGVNNKSISDFSLGDGTSNLGITIYNVTKSNGKIKFSLNLRGDNGLESPVNVKANQVDNQTVDLSWDKNIYYTDYYEVYRDGKLIAKPTENNYKDQNKMEPGKTYTYEIKSHNEKFGTTKTGTKVTITAKDIFTIYSVTPEKSYGTLGKPIKISASAGGGKGKLTYRFYTMWAGSITEIQGFSEKSEVEWIPTQSVPWAFFVEVKDEDGNIIKKNITLNVFGDFVIKDFSIKQSNDPDYGQVIDFKVVKEGGSYGSDLDQMYKFYIKNGNNIEVIQDIAANAFKWIPKYGGTYTFGVEITDKQTGQVAKQEKEFTITGIDKRRATVSINSNGYESGTWTNKDVKLSLDAEKDEESANCELEYKIDDGKWTKYSDAVKFDRDGEYTLSARVNINNGEWYSEEKQFSVRIDKSQPKEGIILGVSNNESRYIGYFICVNSKVDNIKSITLDSKPLEDGNVLVDAVGDHSIVVEDEASNKVTYNFSVKELLSENAITLENKGEVSSIESDFNKVSTFLSKDKSSKIKIQIDKLKAKVEELNSKNPGKEDQGEQDPGKEDLGKEDPGKEDQNGGDTRDDNINLVLLLAIMGTSFVVIKRHKSIC